MGLCLEMPATQCVLPSDKTQVYHEQIEVKQRELQPWTAKINAKQSELDVATGERDMLVQKAEAAQKAVEDAQATLEQLQKDHEAKVRRAICYLCTIAHDNAFVPSRLKKSKSLSHKRSRMHAI